MANVNFIRTKKERNYTVMDNTFLQDKTLSIQAKGLFAYLLSLPENWTILQTEIATHFPNGKDTIRTAFNDLEKHGYVIKTPRKENGKFAGYIYTFCEKPELNRVRKTEIDQIEADGIEIGSVEAENPPLLNTNIQNTNKPNTNIQNISSDEPCKTFDEYLEKHKDDYLEKSLDFSSAEAPEEKPAPKKTRTRKTTKTPTPKSNSFPKSDYLECIELLDNNKKLLSESGKVVEAAQYSYPAITKMLKQCFESYGVENTKKGIANSIKNTWLIEKTKYSYTALLSDKVFPKCIAGEYNQNNQSYKSYSKHNVIDYQNQDYSESM